MTVRLRKRTVRNIYVHTLHTNIHAITFFLKAMNLKESGEVIWEGLEGGKRRDCCNQIIISKIVILKINIFQKTNKQNHKTTKKKTAKTTPVSVFCEENSRNGVNLGSQGHECFLLEHSGMVHCFKYLL